MSNYYAAFITVSYSVKSEQIPLIGWSIRRAADECEVPKSTLYDRFQEDGCIILHVLTGKKYIAT